MLCNLVKSRYKRKVSKKSKLNAVEGLDKVVSKTLAVELVCCVKTGQEKRKRKSRGLCTVLFANDPSICKEYISKPKCNIGVSFH